MVRVTAGGWWTRDGSALPLALCVEAAAQAAGELLAPAGEDSPNWALAGIERATLDRLVTAGETLQVEVRLERRLGTAVRVAAELRADGIRVGEVRLILGARA